MNLCVCVCVCVCVRVCDEVEIEMMSYLVLYTCSLLNGVQSGIVTFQFTMHARE